MSGKRKYSTGEDFNPASIVQHPTADIQHQLRCRLPQFIYSFIIKSYTEYNTHKKHKHREKDYIVDILFTILLSSTVDNIV